MEETQKQSRAKKHAGKRPRLVSGIVGDRESDDVEPGTGGIYDFLESLLDDLRQGLREAKVQFAENAWLQMRFKARVLRSNLGAFFETTRDEILKDLVLAALKILQLGGDPFNKPYGSPRLGHVDLTLEVRRGAGSDPRNTGSVPLPVAKQPEKEHGGSLIEVNPSCLEDLLSSPEEIAKQLFPQLRDNPQAHIATVYAIHRALSKRVAEVLRPTFISLFRQSDSMNYEELAAFVPQANQLLTDYHLGILNPKTGLPAKLYINRARPTSSAATLELADSRKSKDGRQHRLAVREIDLKHLTLVELVPDPVQKSSHGQGR